jgi:hypothetical protein
VGERLHPSRDPFQFALAGYAWRSQCHCSWDEKRPVNRIALSHAFHCLDVTGLTHAIISIEKSDGPAKWHRGRLPDAAVLN